MIAIYVYDRPTKLAWKSVTPKFPKLIREIENIKPHYF